MALHGQVMVNNKVIGWWEACRTEHLYDTDQTTPYECKVTWVPLDGPQVNPYPSVEFELEHQYSKGALALAAKVLSYVTQEVAQ